MSEENAEELIASLWKEVMITLKTFKIGSNVPFSRNERSQQTKLCLILLQHVPYQWMPPEYLFLEQLHASGDIWSFGVLLWEIYSYGNFVIPS